MKPLILYEGKYTQEDLDHLKNSNKIWETKDIYHNQLGEYFEISHPELKFSPELKEKKAEFLKSKISQESDLLGNWIYFPWNGQLIHTLPENQYHELRTNRNRDLITPEEQKKLKNTCVAIAGLSIGGSITTSLTYLGIANTIKIADFDTLETSNLNRIRAGIQDIGTPKIDIQAHQIYEINPYANLLLYNKGITEKNLTDFLTTDTKPLVVFDAIDDLKMKIRLRLEARKHGIIVMMFTNLGDNTLIDIERYDLDKNLPLFNGRIGDIPEQILEKNITKAEENKYVIGIVGMENVPQKALDSVKQIGTTLVGRPQIASTVIITGGIAAYLTKELILGEDIPSGRKLVKFDEYRK